jgi:hypothetical protein
VPPVGSGLSKGAAALTLVLGLASCSSPEGCLGGDDGHCLPATACERVSFECSDPSLDIAWVDASTSSIEGSKALYATGDLVLSNSRLRAAFAALDEQHLLAPSGGTLIDLVPAEGGADGLNQAFQAVGILPDDAVRYVSVDVLDQRPRSISLVYRGHLDLRPEFSVVTRYELDACEPGLRVRTEIHHGGRDPLTLFPADAFFWGNRGPLPFTPGQGLGFSHPEVALATLSDSFVKSRFMTAAAPGTNDAAYTLVRCDGTLLDGFHSATVSAAGAEKRIVMPGDSAAFERFIGVARGPGHSRAIDLAEQLRGQLFGEGSVSISGRIEDELGQPLSGDAERVSLLVRDANPGVSTSGSGAVVATAAPAPDGTFRVRVPRGRRHEVRVSLFGKVLDAAWPVDAETLSTGTIVVPAWGTVSAKVTDPNGAPIFSELVLVPADPERAAESRGSIFGEQAEPHCAPFLGPVHGGSPACNRVLVGSTGTVSFAAPPGEYFAYATHGPFWSLAREPLTVEPGVETALEFTLAPLDLLPEGALSGDFHVHGAASFDSSLPDRDRALSFVANDVNVIVATDHDVVTDYQTVIRALGIGDRVHVVAGVETTGHVLFYRPPGSEVPKVVGHYNFWPLAREALAPRHGAPSVQRLEPGGIFDRMRPHFTGTGVVQMNHPYADDSFGRDQGYLSAVEYDPRKNVPAAPDDTPEGELARRTRSGTSNLGFDAQEVMNGASVNRFFHYRAAWFSFLNQGILRAGTANSDSHTLAVEVLGYPRNVVLGQGSLAEFDQERFDDAVRNGRSFGTNGPVLRVCVLDQGECGGSALTPRTFGPDATLTIGVSAAPWIPVDEARVYVNGVLARTVPVDAIPADALSSRGAARLNTVVPLSELGAKVSGDFWIVVEAGMKLPLAGDLDDDGLVDTTDNDGNGRVDDADAPAHFREPGRVPLDDPRFHFQSIAPGVLPLSFANPILVDREGDGFRAPRQR